MRALHDRFRYRLRNLPLLYPQRVIDQCSIPLVEEYGNIPLKYGVNHTHEMILDIRRLGRYPVMREEALDQLWRNR
ncbi:hypothetical protein D3C81_2148720 [compost metagenome]